MGVAVRIPEMGQARLAVPVAVLPLMQREMEQLGLRAKVIQAVRRRVLGLLGALVEAVALEQLAVTGQAARGVLVVLVLLI